MNRSILLPALWLLATTTIAQDKKPPTTTGPVITFEKTVHDYGSILQGGNGNCEFAVTNTGDQPLILSQCQSSCGCVVPRCPYEPILPGKSATVHVKYDTNRVGPINKSVTVTSNAVNTPVVVLHIKGSVLPLDTGATPTPVPALPKP